ncbi:sulfatase-like hydrolase/transferase [Nonomuraea candida]|uniref:sulfatase-like hydrolase/transferase n=1 Tax=Nonomuraea candida TaxID=359159 RepID=UPI0012F88FB9|nr:sulfatase-like hydrolase/transferase [Nonomuraea candida]
MIKAETMNLDTPTRRAFLTSTGALATTTLLGAAGRARAATPSTLPTAPAAPAAPARSTLPRRPNIVIILADDLGYGQLGCYGQKLIDTPNLDRLAAQGLRFTSAYAGAPVCGPSRACLLTGLHAGHATVRENPLGGPDPSLTSADVTFAGLLKLAGYRTACIGKWGFGPEIAGQPSHPNARGFGEFFGFIGHKHAHQYWPRYLWHNRATVPLNGAAYAPDLFLSRARAFITAAAAAGEPFLLYLPTTLPHSPSDVPGDAGRYEDEPWTRANRRHAAQVTRLDAHVGRIVRTLREAGVADSTLLLFTGDNGPHREKGVTPRLFDSNGPYRADKGDLYEGGIRVPMIAWSPALPDPGRVIDEPVAFWDVLPTLADLAGIPAPAHLDGTSLRGLLDGSGFTGHSHLLWNRPDRVQAIRRGDWKAIRFAPGVAGAGPGGRFELYDLSGDPGERHNLARARPHLAAELNAAIDASIAPDPRLPYGMRLTSTSATADRPCTVTVTLHNGSATTWTDLRIRLHPPAGWHITGQGRHAPLRPGASATLRFTLTPPAQATPTGTLTATARFTTGGRHVRFRTRKKITTSMRTA